MIGYLSIVLLVGVSLASNVAGRASGVNNELVDTDACQELKNVKSCTALAKDVVELDVVVANMTAQAAIIYTDGVKIVAKFDTCGFKLINKEIKCLEQVYSSTVALVAKAKADFAEFESEIETLVTKIESDIQTCTSKSGYSSEKLNSLLTQCKSSLL